MRSRINNAIRKHPALIISLLILLWSGWQIAFGERIPVNQGLGWDGIIYAKITAQFPDVLTGHALNPYWVTRVLPPALVHYGLILFRQPQDAPHIFLGFQILNALLLGCCGILWAQTAKSSGLQTRTTYLGAFLLFVSFSCLRWPFYYPTLTDAAGFALGMLAAYGCTTGHRWATWTSILAGAFTWPTMLPLGALLVVFPAERHDIGPVKIASRPFQIACGILLIAYLAGLGYVRGVEKYDAPAFAPVFDPILPISLIAFSIFFACALYAVIRTPLFYPARLLRSVRWPQAILVLAILAMTWEVSRMLGQGSPDVSAASLCRDILVRPVRMPLISLVGLTSYFGPLVLLSVMFWKSICETAHRIGIGVTLFLGCGLILSFSSDARHMVNVIPLTAVLLSRVLNRKVFSGPFLLVLGGTSLLFSKVWFPINRQPFPENPFDTSSYSDFPWQNLFMHSGHSMSYEMYLVHAAAALLSGIALWKLLKPAKPQEQAKAEHVIQ